MDITRHNQSSPRQAILVVSHSDGFIEAFGEKNIDTHLVRIPTAFSSEAIEACLLEWAKATPQEVCQPCLATVPLRCWNLEQYIPAGSRSLACESVNPAGDE